MLVFLYRELNQLYVYIYQASQVVQMVKNLPAMLENLLWPCIKPRVQFLGQEDPLEKELENFSSILAWRIPWTEEPGGLQFVGCKELDMSEVT